MGRRVDKTRQEVNWWIDEMPYAGPVDDSDIVGWLSVDPAGPRYAVTRFQLMTYPTDTSTALANGETLTIPNIRFEIN